jgi:hypothetical protein
MTDRPTLPAALTQIAAGASSEQARAAAGSELPLGPIHAAARRRRVRWQVGVTAAAAAVVGVLVLGGAAAGGLLDRDPAPVPPATEEPRETPDRTPAATPTPTPTPTPTEAAWEPSWDLCGMPADGLYARETAWDEATETGWWIESMWPYDTTVPVDGLLPLTLSVNGPEVAAVTVEAQLTEFVALETDYATGAGQVAGVAAMPTGDLVRGRGTEEDAVSLGSIEMRLVSCDASPLTGGDGALDTSLTGQGYDVIAVADISPDGGDTVTAVAYVGHIGEYPPTAVEPPSNGPATTGPAPTEQSAALTVGTPLRLGPSATWNNSNLPAEEQALWCGAPAPTASLRNDPVPALTLTGSGFRDGEELIVQMTLTNTWGSPVPSGSMIYPSVSVSRNGRIVGNANAYVSSYSLPEPLQPGESVQLEMSLGHFTCTFMMGEPWPAGTYELDAGTYLYVSHDVTPGIPGYQVRTTFTLD